MKNLIIYLFRLRRLMDIQSSMKILSYWVCILFASTVCLAQERIREKAEIRDAINRFFFKDRHLTEVADSAMFYTFFFKVEVVFNNGKHGVIVIPGDSTAVKICPDYRDLSKFDYSLFMNNRTKATFILPVIFEVIDAQGKRYRFSHNSDLTDAMLALYPRNPPNPTIDDYLYFTPFTILISKEVHD